MSSQQDSSKKESTDAPTTNTTVEGHSLSASQQPGAPINMKDEPNKVEVTLTDRLNKKLLSSFLERLNDASSNAVVDDDDTYIPDEEFDADCTPQDIRNSVLNTKK